jgi:hypothetical protein
LPADSPPTMMPSAPMTVAMSLAIRSRSRGQDR